MPPCRTPIRAVRQWRVACARRNVVIFTDMRCATMPLRDGCRMNTEQPTTYLLPASGFNVDDAPQYLPAGDSPASRIAPSYYALTETSLSLVDTTRYCAVLTPSFSTAAFLVNDALNNILV